MFRDTIKENSGKHFYFMSSCSVYGKTTEAVNEYTEPMITSLYSKLKIECEKLMLKEDNSFKIFRISTLYGRGDFQRNDILINNLIEDIKEGKRTQIGDSVFINSADKRYRSGYNCRCKKIGYFF